jgi:protein TonB
VLVPGPQRIGMTDFGGSVGSGVQIMQPIIDRTGRQGIVLRGIDGDVTPIIRATPQYPPRAIKGQIEGWVRVQFSVTPAGTVRDAIVVDAEPDAIFDDAALKAIARWRYNPKVEGGEAVERVGLQAVIRFELED